LQFDRYGGKRRIDFRVVVLAYAARERFEKFLHARDGRGIPKTNRGRAIRAGEVLRQAQIRRKLSGIRFDHGKKAIRIGYVMNHRNKHERTSLKCKSRASSIAPQGRARGQRPSGRRERGARTY
jgi:hypothetical protein